MLSLYILPVEAVVIKWKIQDTNQYIVKKPHPI